jgi:hypothetical protein
LLSWLLLSVFHQPLKRCRLQTIKLKTVWSFKSLAGAALAFIAVLVALAVATATTGAVTGAPQASV